MYQIQDDAKDKFEELNNEVADNSTRISSNENQNIEQGKVLFLLKACFDLISGSSLSMKIQIMGGKITENLVFKSPLRKVNFLFVVLFFFSFSNSSHKSGYLWF